MLQLLLPPNILVKMMMSDRDFYISPQLASQPCSPSTFTIGGGLTQAHQSLTSPFPLPLPARNPPFLPPDTQACCHQCHSQPPSFSMSLFNCRLRQKNREWKTHHRVQLTLFNIGNLSIYLSIHLSIFLYSVDHLQMFLNINSIVP